MYPSLFQLLTNPALIFYRFFRPHFERREKGKKERRGGERGEGKEGRERGKEREGEGREKGRGGEGRGKEGQGGGKSEAGGEEKMDIERLFR